MRLARWAVMLLTGMAAACAPTTGSISAPVEVVVVLDSLDATLSIFPVDSPGIVHSIPVRIDGVSANTVPSALALHGQLAAVGLGLQLEVIDLGTHQPVCGPASLGPNAPIAALAIGDNGQGYAALPAAHAVAPFQLVADSSCHSNLDPYAGVPQGFGNARGSIFVLIGNTGSTPCVPGVSSICPSWLTSTPPSADSIPLAGPGNARAAVFASDGFLYVLSAGLGTAPDGTLSQIDPLQKNGLGGPTFPGFGHLPSYLATDNAGHIFVTSPVDSALMVFNVRTHLVEKSYTSPVALGGASRGVAVDDLNRVYVLLAGACTATGTRGSVHVLGPDLVATRDLPVGHCPIAIGVTDIPAAAYDFR